MRNAQDVLGDRYRLDRPIATGGMGEVWQATDTVLGRTVAVKVLLADLSADESFGARFRAEARTLATVHHPGVVEVYDYGEIPSPDGTVETAYLVMAYVEGEPLSHRLAAVGRLSPAETMSVVAQTARALEAAHAAGIVHRDVKPDNLLIDAAGHVVLVDFGVARTTATDGLTGAQEVIGTARYMAPEQITKRPTSPATDLYALGVVAYHCLVGEPPFTGGSAIAIAVAHVHDEPPPLPDDIPPAVRDVVTTAMAKDPLDRFPSAEAVAVAAEAAAATTGTTAPLSAAPVSATPLSAAPMAMAPLPDAPGIGSTRRFAAVPGMASGRAGVSAPAGAPALAEAPYGPAAPGRPSRVGRRVAVAVAACLIAAGIATVLVATLHPGASDGRPVVGTTGGVTHPKSSAHSTPAGHGRPSGSTQASTRPTPSTGPTATPTATATAHPTATAPPTSAPPTTGPTTTPPADPTSAPPTDSGGGAGAGAGAGASPTGSPGA